MVCCLPDARVQDISEQLLDILKGKEKQPEVIVHVDTNDMGRKRNEVLQYKYRELSKMLQSRIFRL